MKRIFLLLLFLAPGASGAFAVGVEDYYREAGQFFAQKDYARALDAYQAAIPLEPNPYRAWAGMGNCAYAEGDKSKALEYFRKSLGLYPDNPPLAQFVEKLKVEILAKGGPYAKGLEFFRQKRFAEAAKELQTAVREDPDNLDAFYDLGYCQYFLGDQPEAALNFGYYGKKKPEPKSLDFASKIRATLSPDDRQWLDDQWKSGPPFTKPFRFSGWGLRLDTSLQMVSLKDLNDAVHTLRDFGKQQQSTDPSYQLSADVPSFGLGLGLNPFFQVFDPLDLGFTFDTLFLGEFDASYQSDTNGSGNGLMDFQIFDFGLDLRARFLKFQKGKIDVFVDANPGFYFVGTHVVNSTDASWGFVPATGDFSGSGAGARFKLGVDWKPLPNSVVSVYGGYQIATVEGFKGSAASTPTGTPQAGQLEVERNQGQTSLQFIPDGTNPVLPSGASLSPLTVDLSGLLFGFNLTVLL